MKMNNAEFNIGSLVTSLSAIFYDQCANKNIDFNVILKNIHSENLIGDSVRLNQVLLNFLSNSVKFTPSGGKITFRIEVIHSDAETMVIRFVITDTGCGISEELKKRLFEPFEREVGEKAHKYGGTGLGLSISKKIIELMNGQVGVKSVEGMGSSFWTELPFAISENNAAPPRCKIEGLKIAVVISNEDEREYIGQILKNFGISFTLMATAESLISRLKDEAAGSSSYNLCILDWKLSDFNALDVSVKIRKEFDVEKLKIVVLAYDLTMAKSISLEDNTAFILAKPVFSSVLYNLLQEISTNAVQNIPERINSYNLNGSHILLVEDNIMNIEIAEQLLNKFNATMEKALNGKQGYEKFIASEEGHFDAILMDIQMPIMDGYESTIAIRNSSHKDARKIPIFAMTADAFSEDVEKAKVSGMNEHISKPIDPDVLYQVLKKYLDK